MRKIALLPMVCLLFLCLATPALADGLIIPAPQPIGPQPVSLPLRSLAIKYHDVTVTIDNQVAVTHVDQVFRNDTNYELEGEYVFPLPEGASVSEFALWVDGERVEAKLLDSDEARDIYEEIVRERKDPALLEYVGRNAFRARIYPIPARGEKRVELQYSEILPQDGGLVRYLYPLNTEKFSSEPLERVSVQISITSHEALGSIYSPSHAVEITKSTREAKIFYADEEITPATDFALYYSLDEESWGINVLSYREPEEDGYFLALLTPPTITPQEVIPRDVIFCLDSSGSMRGEKLQQAKDAARYVLEHLNQEDRFNLIIFNTDAKSYTRRPERANDVDAALSYLDQVVAGGGTNIERALELALGQQSAERACTVVFLTDGLPTQGTTSISKLIDMVGTDSTSETSIFCFGVGYDVNTVLLDTISQNHHGTTTYVRPEEHIEHAVSAFYEKISLPVLSSVELEFGEIIAEDIYPYPLPDLFAGSQLVVVGRYRQPGDTAVTLFGETGSGLLEKTYTEIRFRDHGGSEFIPRLWATRKVGYLLTQIRLYGPSDELIDEVIALAEEYGIVTPYTSFLVEDTGSSPKLTRPGGGSAIPLTPAPNRAPASSAYSGDARAAVGAEAVEASDTEKALRQAEVVSQPVTQEIKVIGAKTFVRVDGCYVDTAFDANKMQTDAIPFGSSRYTSLLNTNPEWGRYLALGDSIIFVADDQAYEITPDTPQLAPASESVPEESNAIDPGLPVGIWEHIGDWWRSFWGAN